MSQTSPHANNTGVLFGNSESWIAGKTGRPEYGGECTVGTQRYRVAGWKRTAPNGKKYLALAFSQPKPQEAK